MTKEVILLQGITKCTHKRKELHRLGIAPEWQRKNKNSFKICFIRRSLESV